MQRLYEKLFSTEEGKILIFGMGLTIALTIFILITYLINPIFANKISGMVVTNIAVGRVPSLSFGYAAGLSHFAVIFTNVLVEMIMVMILYPLFVFSFNNILRIEILEKFFINVQNYKKEHQKWFDKYGILGLFIFVFIPFWMTGPIVGSMIGYLIGVKHFTTMITVAIATTIAMTLWGIFLHELVELLMLLDSTFVWIFIVILITVFIIIRLSRR